MKAAVIVFPGSNCDRDVAVALEQASGTAPLMVWHRQTELPDLDLIVVPGGFAYGDYLRAGAMAAHSPVMRVVAERAAAGVRVLGICNGFQVLVETGLLPGALMTNRDLKFVSRTVTLRVESADSIFTAGYRDGAVIRLPIANHQGSYYADDNTVRTLEDKGLVAFRYVAADGRVGDEDDDDANPNGSAGAIAGLFNPQRNVLGLMPHPERAADPELGNSDGRAMFASLA
ncbi:MAG: phosphoribosylformylglycinamidine synthase subunit PurQ, partial [Rhodospirillaceae bacterium]|nr:phosphoribosylformylglycinamidine synthase subunit PurQ [Rhodospirillaceae bacterium]